MKKKEFLKELQAVVQEMNGTDEELFHNLNQQEPTAQAELRSQLEAWAKQYFVDLLQDQRKKDKKLLRQYQKQLLHDQKAIQKFQTNLNKLERMNRELKDRVQRLEEKEKRTLEIVRQLCRCLGFDFEGRKAKYILRNLRQSTLYLERSGEVMKNRHANDEDSFFKLSCEKGGR